MFTSFEIVGIVVSVVLASILFGIIEYAFKLWWLIMLPFRLLRHCCSSMTYDGAEEEATCCGTFGNNYVV